MNKTKPPIYLFCDASLHPQSGIGFGAYLLLENNELFGDNIKDTIKIKKFENTSSTKLELETLLWAFNEPSLQESHITVYTDCQNIITLNQRRERFEQNNYKTRKGKEIKNHQLYKEFYRYIDTLECTFVKLKGHKKSSIKSEIDTLFTLVDRATRKSLRRNFFENLYCLQ
ncbi:MAG: RNase H family protein [Campylobacterota bacterium]|nr:RNase H family protein [Campylobacterota bacterium]